MTTNNIQLVTNETGTNMSVNVVFTADLLINQMVLPFVVEDDVDLFRA